MVLQKKCNKCGEVKDYSLMVKNFRYKDCVEPKCIECSKKKCLEYYKTKGYVKRMIKNRSIPKGLKKGNQQILNITEEGLIILINNGFARSREEALKYIK